MIALEITLGSIALLAIEVILLALSSALLAAWLFRRHRPPERPQTLLPSETVPPESLEPQLQALQRNQERLATCLEDCRAIVMRIERRQVASGLETAPHPRSEARTVVPAARIPTATPRVSARSVLAPPTPVPRPRAAIAVATPPETELTDEEIDALPPDLPAATRPRKRSLPPPRKPPLQSL